MMRNIGERKDGYKINDLGINFYDTAIAYQAGTSEEYLGGKNYRAGVDKKWKI